MKTLLNYNWPNGLLLVIFIILLGIDLGRSDVISALGDGFVAIFNMFMIFVLNQRRIITGQEEQKEREEKIIDMLKEKENKL